MGPVGNRLGINQDCKMSPKNEEAPALVGKNDAPSHENTWNKLTTNKEIKSGEVLDVYKEWAAHYQQDMDKVNPKKSEHVARYLYEMLLAEGKNPSEVTVLDVAAGTGHVGVELAKLGFRHITATDYCQEMLDVAKQKGVYKEMICCKFGTTIPSMLKARKFDCVVMHGGFAAGHLPLSSLHTMSRLCKKGGFMINSMSLQYTYYVDEYADIHSYVQELADAKVWRVEFTRVLENCMSDRHALVHGFRVL